MEKQKILHEILPVVDHCLTGWVFTFIYLTMESSDEASTYSTFLSFKNRNPRRTYRSCSTALISTVMALSACRRWSRSWRASQTTSLQKTLRRFSIVWTDLETEQWTSRSSKYCNFGSVWGLNIRLFLQAVMVEIEDAGWRQVAKTEDRSAIKEEEVRTLFNMIDKDRSGSLSKRVREATPLERSCQLNMIM